MNCTNHVDLVVYVPQGNTADRKEQTQLTKWELNAQKRTERMSPESSKKANPFFLLIEHLNSTFYGCHASLFFMFGNRFCSIA